MMLQFEFDNARGTNPVRAAALKSAASMIAHGFAPTKHRRSNRRFSGLRKRSLLSWKRTQNSSVSFDSEIERIPIELLRNSNFLLRKRFAFISILKTISSFLRDR
jgi:hypothetical protein